MEFDVDNLSALVASPHSLSDPLHVLYEDNHLLAVYKPHRLLIQADKTGHGTLFAQTCSWLKEKYQKPGNVYLGMVHRLDRPASGIVLFAKTSKAAGRLSEEFRTRKVKKVYEALVQGEPLLEKSRLVHYLVKPEEGPSVVHDEEVEGAQRAELEYEVLGTAQGKSLIRVELLTGRRHQIRAQLAAIGCPILGDGRYGATEQYLEGSIALVAQELGIAHPVLKERMVFTLPLSLHSVRMTWNASRIQENP